MKKILLLIIIASFLLFIGGCEKFSNLYPLTGKTFTYWSGYTGQDNLISNFMFETDGHVTWNSTIGYKTKTFEHLTYKQNGSKLEIYTDRNKQWKKESKNTIMFTGTYSNSTIVFDELSGMVHKLN